MKRDTAIARVITALQAEGGKASTQALCERLTGVDRGIVLMALAHLKRREIVDSDFVPSRKPDCGWTYWFTPAKRSHRGSRFKAAISNGYTRLVVEWIDAQGGEVSIEKWSAWSVQIEHRIRLHSAVHSLRRRNLIALDAKHIKLTDQGRQALTLGRSVVPIAPTLEDFQTNFDFEVRASTDPEVSIARAERLWPRLLQGRRFEDVPAHLIRKVPVLRMPTPLSSHSVTGNAGAMCADWVSARGGKP